VAQQKANGGLSIRGACWKELLGWHLGFNRETLQMNHDLTAFGLPC